MTSFDTTDTTNTTYEINRIGQNQDQNLKYKTYTKNGVEYSIINYDSSFVCFDDHVTGLYRSVIASSPENKVLGFSPPKSIPIDTFKIKYPNLDQVVANEIVEGTMINLFYDNRIQQWEISTRGAVGGTYFYYRTQYEDSNQKDSNQKDSKKKQTTFAEMFLDAFSAAPGQILNDLPFLECMPKTYSYSFVLQHPENHIVLHIEKPKLYLVAVFEVIINGASIENNNIIQIPSTLYETWDMFTNIRGVIDFPTRYSGIDYETLENEHCSIHQSFTSMGVMFTSLVTGERTAMKNPNYEEIKLLRGNNPNLQYHYLCMHRAKKVKDFLHYFPQYKSIFYRFYTGYNDFITNVHLSYLTYYVQKQQVKISKKYFPHIYKIHHELYIPSLSTETPLIIRRRVVRDYFDDLSPREMLYYLNYDRREYSKPPVNQTDNEHSNV